MTTDDVNLLTASHIASKISANTSAAFWTKDTAKHHHEKLCLEVAADFRQLATALGFEVKEIEQ